MMANYKHICMIFSDENIKNYTHDMLIPYIDKKYDGISATLLHHYVYYYNDYDGTLDTLKNMLKYISVNAKTKFSLCNNQQATPIMYAIQTHSPNLDVIKILIDAGADLDYNYNSPLILAIHEYNRYKTQTYLYIIKLLIDGGSNVNQTTPALAKHIPIIAANITSTEQNLSKNPLNKLLLDAGADVNAKDCRGNTVRDIIAKNKQKTMPPITKPVKSVVLESELHPNKNNVQTNNGNKHVKKNKDSGKCRSKKGNSNNTRAYKCIIS